MRSPLLLSLALGLAASVPSTALAQTSPEVIDIHPATVARPVEPPAKATPPFWLHVLRFSIDLGPSFPFRDSASILQAVGVEVGGGVALLVRPTSWISFGIELRGCYHRWGLTDAVYLGYTTPGSTSTAAGLVGPRVVFHIGRFEIGSAVHVGISWVDRTVERFARFSESETGVVLNLELGAAARLTRTLGLGLGINVTLPTVGNYLERSRFTIGGLGLYARFIFDVPVWT
jgi:hypothetical protein